MPHYNNAIDNLNRKLYFKLNKIKFKPSDDSDKEVTVETYLKQAFNQHYGGTTSSNSSMIDVPDVSAVDDEYKTNDAIHIKKDHEVKERPQENPEEEEKRDLKDTPISVDLGNVREERVVANRYDKENIDQREKARKEHLQRRKEDKARRMRENEVIEELFGKVQEQGEELAPDPSAPTEPAEPDMSAEPDMGGDPGMGAMGVDPGMDPNMAMPGTEEPKNPTELGRTYEMKKIYSRLVAMNQYLADEMSPKIYKTKQSIAKSIDLFAVIGANPESYTDRIDEIIVGYYKFLEAAYKIVKSYYKGESKNVGDTTLEKNEEQKGDKGYKPTEVKI
jgi:hypothetical protein